MSMDIALLALSAALLSATVVYVVYTARMATEMRRARLLSVQPHLLLDISMLGPMYGMVSITNVGPGAAVDVDLSIVFEPVGERRPWRALRMLPHESAEFGLPLFDQAIGSDRDIPTAAKAGATVSVTGSVADVYGTRHAIGQQISIADWWNVVVEADQRFVEKFEVEAIRELTKLRKSLEVVAAETKGRRIRQLIRRRRREEPSAPSTGEPSADDVVAS